jgi:hypothetical protein
VSLGTVFVLRELFLVLVQCFARISELLSDKRKHTLLEFLNYYLTKENKGESLQAAPMSDDHAYDYELLKIYRR